MALRRHALGDGMLDTMLMWRGEQLRPAANQSIKHMQAWKLKTNVSVDMLEEQEVDALSRRRASRSATSRSAWRSATSIFAFPSSHGATAIRGSTQWYASFAARPSVKANEPKDEP